MSAQLCEPVRRLQPMKASHLDAVMAVEQAAYAFPWTRGNFVDSLAAGYFARVLFGEPGELLGYHIAMAGLDEMHLLNITVAPAWQGQGLARLMLDRLVALCRRERLQQLWLEVRESNDRARQVYRRYGFAEVGRRRGYYPTPVGPREDAILMSLRLTP